VVSTLPFDLRAQDLTQRNETVTSNAKTAHSGE
jgi:hypothetical protein